MAGPEVNFEQTTLPAGDVLIQQTAELGLPEAYGEQLPDVVITDEQITLSATRVRPISPLDRLHAVEEDWRSAGTPLNPRYF